MSESFQAYPTLPSLRFATAADVPRLADIDVLGFKDADETRYWEPLHGYSPQDALASSTRLYRLKLLELQCVVVVSEDWQASDEASLLSPRVDDGLDRNRRSMKRVVVGSASFSFPEGSPRIGQFVVAGVGDPGPHLYRDICQRRRIYNSVRIQEAGDKK